MTSRPLLDYLVYPDDAPMPAQAAARAQRPMDALEARLKDLEMRLRGSATQAASAPAPAPEEPAQADSTLSAQIEAILRRKEVVQSRNRAAQMAAEPRTVESRSVESRPFEADIARARALVDPPSSVPAHAAPGQDADFARFSEAVYLIGQAARRFAETPPVAAVDAARHTPPIATQPAAAAPSTTEIEALSAVLRETVSAFRSVSDDLAVSVGEIRHAAARDDKAHRAATQRASDADAFADMMRETLAGFRSVADDLAHSVGQMRKTAEREPRLERPRAVAAYGRGHEDDEILELRDNVSDLQQRLDTLLQARRRARY